MTYKILLGSALALTMSVLGSATLADYPEKPVSFIVPWPPGDLEDVLTRLIAEDFQAEYGVSAAVINKPGGGGGPFPGAIEVARAPADGYTIGSFVIGVPVMGHQIEISDLTPEKFDPLGIFLTYPFVLATSMTAPYASMAELIEYAKMDSVTLGHFGDGLAPTRVSKAFAKSAGFSWGSDAAFDMLDCNTLASGDADVINTTLQLILPCLDKVKVLASLTGERISLAPNAPTMGELNPELNISLWNGLFVRKGTPQDVRDKIVASAQKTVMGARARAVAEETGALVYWMSAKESADQISKDIQTMERISNLLN
jgi:tripartite-type tricarboxylate transporter receptor subunit TctC